MFSVIYSADIAFQVITVLKGKMNNAWIVANEMSRNGKLKAIGVEHYDVIQFKSLDDMNNWIMEQVKESREEEVLD